jgi:hypothetical protein
MADGQTRQRAALGTIAATLKTLGADRIVLIDSVTEAPIELADVDALSESGVLRGADSAANLPEMLSAAATYLKAGDRRVADIWVCSDRQDSDWRPESPRWRQVASEWDRIGQGVRLHLLDFPPDGQVNASITVSGTRGVETRQGREFVLSATVTREDEASMVIPVRVAVGGLTQLVDVPIVRGRGRLEDFRVKAKAEAAGAFGKLSIPADLNAADDQWFFAVAADPNRPIGLVKEESCEALEAVSEVLGTPVFGLGGQWSREKGSREAGSRLKSGRFPIDEVACLIWQGRLPEGEDADEVTRFLSGGGSVVFFPPKQSIDEIEQRSAYQGVRWGDWQRNSVKRAVLDQWDYSVRSFCPIVGDVVRLSSAGTQNSGNKNSGRGELLIGKLRVGQGTAWFCGADVIDSDSAFVQDGLVLYALLSEALEASLLHASVGDGWVAGEIDPRQLPEDQELASLTRVLPAEDRVGGSIEFGHHAGVFQTQPSTSIPFRMFAINRPAGESQSPRISDDQLPRLLPGVEWNLVRLEGAGSEPGRGFVREAWGTLWILLIAGMLLEAWLSLPSRVRGAA